MRKRCHKMKWLTAYKNEKIIESQLKEIFEKGYFANGNNFELEPDEKEDVEEGLKFMADSSGSFNDVFFMDNVVLKFHSRFDSDFEDWTGLDELDLSDVPLVLYFDYEVLEDLENLLFTPCLYGFEADESTRVSLLEKIDGNSLGYLIKDNVKIDYEKFSTFLIDFFDYSFSKGWVPLDLSADNIIQQDDGNFKIIDFSCFMKIEDFYEASESGYDYDIDSLLSLIDSKEYRQSYAQDLASIIIGKTENVA